MVVSVVRAHVVVRVCVRMVGIMRVPVRVAGVCVCMVGIMRVHMSVVGSVAGVVHVCVVGSLAGVVRECVVGSVAGVVRVWTAVVGVVTDDVAVLLVVVG